MKLLAEPTSLAEECRLFPTDTNRPQQVDGLFGRRPTTESAQRAPRRGGRCCEWEAIKETGSPTARTLDNTDQIGPKDSTRS